MGLSAYARRQSLGLTSHPGADGFRLAFSESDGLPGLTVDVFADTAVVQSETPGPDAHMEAIGEFLLTLVPGLATVFERSDTESRRREGLEPRVRILAGKPLAGPVFFEENGWKIIADPQRGQKTGAYLDLRNARILWTPLLAGRSVLDVCCYAGALSALGLVQARPLHCNWTKESARSNWLPCRRRPYGISDRCETLRGNLFEALPTLVKGNRQFGAVILDPPRLAASRAQVPDALRTLERLLRTAVTLVEPDGLLMVFSCTGLLYGEPFEPILEAAAHKAGRRGILLDRIAQPADHPVPLTFPEAAYLKGLLLRIE